MSGTSLSIFSIRRLLWSCLFALFEQLKNKIDTQKIEEPWGWARIFFKRSCFRDPFLCVEKMKLNLVLNFKFFKNKVFFVFKIFLTSLNIVSEDLKFNLEKILKLSVIDGKYLIFLNNLEFLLVLCTENKYYYNWDRTQS